MEEKVDSQLSLAKKIRAVDHKDTAERVLVSHFLPDIAGNVRAFLRQKLDVQRVIRNIGEYLFLVNANVEEI